MKGYSIPFCSIAGYRRRKNIDSKFSILQIVDGDEITFESPDCD